jgi:hypothetical protein
MIESGQPFGATLDGVVVFPESYMELGFAFFRDAPTEGNLVELQATVRVREGADGPAVVLRPDKSIAYRCSSGRQACHPDNDLPSVPGHRGNTDCGETNPCGRFIDMPVDSDCSPGGVCAELGKTGPGSQCDKFDLCITGDLRIELEAVGEIYTPDAAGAVRFGWDDTHLRTREGGDNDGTWIMPKPNYEDPTGPIGVRATFFGEDIAFECVMGVDCSDPILGVGCAGQYSSPSPNSELISFPISEQP